MDNKSVAGPGKDGHITSWDIHHDGEGRVAFVVSHIAGPSVHRSRFSMPIDCVIGFTKSLMTAANEAETLLGGETP